MPIYTISRKNKQLYDAISWVARALKTNAIRYGLEFLHIKDNIAEATNGHILFQYNLKDNGVLFNNGLYEIWKTPKFIKLIPIEEQSLTFPDTVKVIPKENCLHKIKIFCDQYFICIVSAKAYESAKIIMDPKYIHALEIKDEYWDMNIYGQSKPVLFISGNHLAVIMPIK
jgi:hypothetical protein